MTVQLLFVFASQMAAIASMLLILLMALPLGLQLEIGGVEVGGGRLLGKISSEITNITKALQPKQISTTSQDSHTENGDDDDSEATGSKLEL
jgi:hypothetical protein